MIIETLLISSVLSALGKSDLVKSLGAKTVAYVAPKFLKKLGSKLKSAAGLDIENLLSKKFNKILEELVPDKKVREETKKKLVKIFSEMIKSQKFDEETFLEKCAKYDLNRDFCEFLWTDFYDTLRNLMISVIDGNDKLLQKTLLGLSYDIKADTTAIKDLIVNMRQDVLTLKEEIISVLRKNKVILMPTDVVLERMIPASPKLFRLSGYLWVDYVSGYVVLREDKYKELVWAVNHGKRFILVKGQPASGKTTFIREILWRLANSGITAWYIDSRLLKMYKLDRVMDELRDINNTWIIIDDAFFAPSQVKEIIEAVRRDPSMNNVLVIVTREGLEDIFSNLVEEEILLKGDEVSEKIILNFARIVNIDLTQGDVDIIKGLSKGNLWILAFALETFYRHRFLNQKLLVKLALDTFKREFQNIFTSILEINEATLLCSTIAFLQSNGITPYYDILLNLLRIDKKILTQLIDVGILRLVTSNCVAIFHDAQADLLRQAVSNEESLMKDILKKIDPVIPPIYRSLMTKGSDVISEDTLVFKLTLVYLANLSPNERMTSLNLIKEHNKPLYDKLQQIITLIEQQVEQEYKKERVPHVEKPRHENMHIYEKTAEEKLLNNTAFKSFAIPTYNQQQQVHAPIEKTEVKEENLEKTTWITTEEERIPHVTIHIEDLKTLATPDSIEFTNYALSLLNRIPVFTEREKIVPILTDLWLRNIRIALPFQVTTPIYKTILELKNKLLSNQKISLDEIPATVKSTKPVLEELALISMLTGDRSLFPSQDDITRINFDRLVKRLLLINVRAIDILPTLGAAVSSKLFIKLGFRASYIENASFKELINALSKDRKLILLALEAYKKPEKVEKVRNWIRNNIKRKIERLKYECILIDTFSLLEDLLLELKTIPADYAIDLFEILLESLGYKNLLTNKNTLSLLLGYISELPENIAVRYKLALSIGLAMFQPIKLIDKLLGDILYEPNITHQRSLTLKMARLSGILCDRNLLNTILSYQKKSIDIREMIEEALLSAFSKIW